MSQKNSGSITRKYRCAILKVLYSKFITFITAICKSRYTDVKSVEIYVLIYSSVMKITKEKVFRGTLVLITQI